MSPPRECLYATLGVSQTATESEIRKAYRTLALSHHPDKNPGEETRASEQFKSIQHAYSVLSDEHERAWYDAHRNQILRGHDPDTADPDKQADPADATQVDLFACFSSTAYRGFADDRDGFYAVYADVFERLWQEELDEMMRMGKRVPPAAPFGGVAAEWQTVRAFYDKWDAFSSAKSFAFADKWNLAEAPNREVRRLMDKDNKKARATVRKEFNSTVRELAAFVKKRDPRVARRRKEEQELREKKQAEAKEREKIKAQIRKDNAESIRAARDHALEEDAEGLDQILEALALDELLEQQQRKKTMKRARAKQQIVSASDDENSESEAVTDADASSGDDADETNASESDDITDRGAEAEEEDDEVEVEEEEEDLYCAACRKPFRTAAQKSDHERSKKHKSAVAKLKRELLKEEKVFAKAQGEARDQDSIHDDGSENGVSFDEDEEEAEYLRAKAKESKKKKKQQKRNKQFADSFANSIGDDEQVEDNDGEALNEGEETTGNNEMGCIDESDIPDVGMTNSKQPKLTKKQQRRLREQSRKEAGGDGLKSEEALLRCNVCSATFPSRNKLMRHVEQSGHALHVPSKGSSSHRGKRR